MKKLLLLAAVIGLAMASCKTTKIQRQQSDLETIIESMRKAIPGIDITMYNNKVKVMLTEAVYFKVGSAELNPNALGELDEMARILNKYNRTSIDLNGYTDNTGTKQINEKLSFDRAVSVKKYLQQQNVKSDRMHTFGYADNNPVASNDTEAGRAQNRRVEFMIYYK